MMSVCVCSRFMLVCCNLIGGCWDPAEIDKQDARIHYIITTWPTETNGTTKMYQHNTIKKGSIIGFKSIYKYMVKWFVV